MSLKNIFDNITDHCSDKWDGYFEVYDRHLEKFRNTKATLVEVGVQKGGSLDMWASYLGDNANVIGIDIDPECSKLLYKSKNIKVQIGDQKDNAFWDEFIKQYPKIDIFIDDAGHYCDAQVSNFEKIFPNLPVGSIYICEDVHTSYMPYNGGGYKVKSSFIEYAKNYLDVIHSNWINELDTAFEHKKKIGKDLTSIHCYDSMVIFEKFGRRKMQRVHPIKFGTPQ